MIVAQMARLNEPPIPAESFDIVKRRFTRQNRDLAKINTAQSLRIRALESEVSRLQTENLSLREEVLHLQNQLATTPSCVEETVVEQVRTQLQAKVAEIGDLLSGLEAGRRDRPQKRAADPASWRPHVPTLHFAGRHSQMSPLVEAEHSPRSTPEADELRVPRLSDQSNESPDLGPPPVAHFECEDPIKFDRPVGRRESSGQEPIEEESIPAELSINLETRRKRKDAPAKLSEIIEGCANSMAAPSELTLPTKASTKRKLNIRESDDMPMVVAKEDFRFSRRLSVTGDGQKSTSILGDKVRFGTERLVPKRNTQPAENAAKDRRILGDKSVNMSPQKAISQRSSKHKPDKKPDAGAEIPETTKPRIRKPRVSSVVPLAAGIHPVVATIELPPEDAVIDTLQPKTPAPDLLSPMVSEPSTLRLDDKATPGTCGRLGDHVQDANLEGLVRPSRRARAAVNYAEPSLNTKMRRPTGQLADAIVIRSNSNPPPTSETQKTAKTVFNKKEKDEEEYSSWNDLPSAQIPEPTSPSETKLASIEANVEHIDDKPERINIGRSGGTISALLSKSRQNEDEQTSRMRELEIYEFKGSSPTHEAADARPPPTARRRHSMLQEPSKSTSFEVAVKLEHSPGSSSPASELQAASTVVKRSVSVSSRREAQGAAKLDRRASRRRSMML